jgi:hypothetical protein
MWAHYSQVAEQERECVQVLLRATRFIRTVSTLVGIIAGTMEMRNMYVKRKRMWNILRRLVRQLG